LVAFFRPQGSSLFEKMRILIWLINIEKKKREKLGEYEKGHILGDEPSTVFPHSPPERKQHAKIYLWIVTIQIPAFQLIP
jgi:hypothetical protein